MNRSISLAAFVAGLAAVLWVGVGYIGSSALALAATALIGAVYGTGAIELLRFHQATAALERALAAIPEDLSHPDEWLVRVPPALRNPVRLRIEGERVGLPGPALTPYLVGLLVLLGMLGTFLGMVVTLNGAVMALESTTDLQTIRASLAAPVKGLGVAFGTSVAGVAASAMLGLVSALCRRERLQAAQRLDASVGTKLRRFSLAHQRQETFHALQQQARALPDVMQKLEALMTQMSRQGSALNERLVGEQERFYRDARGTYSELAACVDKSLKESVAHSARLAGESIQPVVSATMGGIARETTALQERLADAVRTQLDGMSERFGTSVAAVVAMIGERAAAQQAELAAKDQARQEQLCRTLGETARDIAASTRAQADSTAAEVARLMQAAAEAPRAAAEVIGALRQEHSAGVARDNALLAERSRIMETLGTLLDAINHGSSEQRQAINALTASAAALLERAGARFAESIEAESARMADAAGQVTAGAVEVASLGEAFGLAVQLFSESNDRLMAALARIEGALDKSLARSDEQLAYYVAQAREIIDLSLMSQGRIIEDLQQLSGRQPSLAGGV